MKNAFVVVVIGGLLLGACDAKVDPPAEVAASSAPGGTPTSASAAAAPPSATTPAVEKRTVTETRKIPYKTRKVSDPALAAGKTKVRRRGVAGVRTLTYTVTYTGGTETSRKLVGAKVTRAPVARVIAVGTKRARSCDPNYSGACVPIASDVDCAGGSGNGPGYVSGPVRVVGSDIYDLDRDGDGIACDT
ncbi:G5 domain-containing protein [Actinomadura bangladeshensis]|uniref:G5 domain-containing protein n=1 Tax=Actinomadura bangladeshensis TaxID=453573 RepID=UPI001A9DE9D0|nr:G5 domain-containing protein [Actinomadura bangladeshensis]